MKHDYDFVVIGGGAAGLVASIGAASTGAKVSLFEHRLLGGECLHSGCVPSKCLVEYSKQFLKWSRSASAIDSDWDLPTKRVVNQLGGHESVQRLSALGIDVIEGEGRFVAKNAIVSHLGKRICFQRALIATGSRPQKIAIAGLEERFLLKPYQTDGPTPSPGNLIIIGGGASGVEYAQAYCRLGTKVILIERGPRLLSFLSPVISDFVENQLRSSGIEVIQGVNRMEFEEHSQSRVRLRYEQKDAPSSVVAADKLLVCNGRLPHVEGLGLEAAGVAYSSNGVHVGKNLRTSNGRIYAAGDCAAICDSRGCFERSIFTSSAAADIQARMVVRNALFWGRQRFEPSLVAHALFVSPEIAWVGQLPTGGNVHAGKNLNSIRYRFKSNDRHVISNQNEDPGFAEIYLHPRSDRIAGATLACTNAGEMIGELSFAIRNKIPLRKLGSASRPYPTINSYLTKMNDEYQRSRLTPNVRRALQGLHFLRRSLPF